MMIQEFISKCVSVLVRSTCAVACCVFAGVGVRLVGSSLLAALAGTRRKCGMLVVSVLMAVSVVCTVVAQKEKGGASASPKGAQTVSKLPLVASRNAAVPAAKSPLAAPTRSPLCALSPSGPEVEPFAAKPANAVENHWWRGRGAHVDGLTIPAEGWNFRTPSGFLESLLVYSYGEIQPDVETTYFLRPFPEADLSLLPEGKWGGNLPEGAESQFWHAASPSNSLILTWQNAAYNRDANCPTNLQIELFPNGTYVYRYDDHTERHSVAYPFDLDGDGLENSVDPEPLVAGPDAHGANAEWYNTVCSNVFSKIEQSNNPNNQSTLLPNGESVGFKSDVNTNAYYFVDVVAERGPAPIYFNSSHPGRLGSPIVVALGGATNRVPLLIGATYSITSDVPFTVACPTNGFAEVLGSDGMSATVKWPLEFTFTEELSGTSRSYTVGVEPYNAGGAFSWGGGQGGATLQGFQPPSGGACGCFSGNGNTVVFGCSPTCTCGGRCRARGWYQFELASFSVEGGECRCGFDDPPASEPPTFGPLDEPTLSVSFSAPAVIFEDAYVDSYDPTKGTSVTQPRRSTRTRLTVSAWGGPNGGTLNLTSQNLGKLAPVACGPMVLPPSVTLAPYQQWSVSYLCEGAEASVEENDVAVCGTFTDGVSGEILTSRAVLTLMRVELSPQVNAPVNTATYRHKYGIGERMDFNQYPSLPALSLVVVGGMENLNLNGEDGDARYVIWGFRDEDHSMEIRWNGVGYRPLVSVVCPSGIETRNVHWETNGLPSGVAGGICLVQQYFVTPLDVSFSALSIEEVPCEDEIPPTGYYAVVTGKFARTHTVKAGAGRWWQVTRQNRIGESVEDVAGCPAAISRIMPDGTETTDPQFGWVGGSLIWKVPFGWQISSVTWPSAALPLGTFAEGSRQMFVITANGDFRIRKLGNEAERKINGTLYLRKGVE